MAAVVAHGEAEIGFQQVSEIVGVPGPEIAGPLPDAVQWVTVFSAGVLTNAWQPEAAAELIRFLASPEAIETVMSTGLAPLRRHHSSAETCAGAAPTVSCVSAKVQ